MLGLRANAGQFALLVAVNGLVGGMIGQERTVLPLLARDAFGLTGAVSILTFIGAFGLTKALANLAAGALADRFGRKPVLVAGWLVGLPVPVLLILGAAPHEGGPDSKEVDLLSKGLSSFSLQLVPQAGHHIQEERPAELAVLISAFDVARP